jgi:hypothetical protein
MNKGHHTPVNDLFFRLEKESKSIHSSLKKSWQKNNWNKKRAAETAAPSGCLHAAPSSGGWSEALRQQCLA